MTLKIVWTLYSSEYGVHRLGVCSARAIFNSIIFVQVAFECFPLTYPFNPLFWSHYQSASCTSNRLEFHTVKIRII